MEKEILMPFDAHVHFRTGDMLKTVIPYTARICGEAVAMGNLPQPVDDLDSLLDYCQELDDATAENYPLFRAVMTIMLTPRTTVHTIQQCASLAKALKFIPASTSTNAQSGIRLEDLEKYYPILNEVKNQGMIFSVHAERIQDDNGEYIPEKERESAAIPFISKLIKDMPGLKIIIEHVSTKEMCELVINSPANVAATITAHHVCFNDSFLFNKDGTVRPSFYCKPVLKSEEHRQFIENTMLSGNPKFFFGSDSAPHSWEAKFHKFPPAAGVFSAPVAIPLMVGRFYKADELDKAENFLSIFGRKFYELPMPNRFVILSNDRPYFVPKRFGPEEIPVLLGGSPLVWSIRPVNYD
jgi:dihydroorotase